MDLRKIFTKKEIRASLTMEASFVITMTIFVLGIMISLWIYKFQMCWYTQAISECLLVGSNRAVLHGEDYVNDTIQKWEIIKEENCLVPQALEVEIKGEKDEFSIEASGKTPIWGYAPLGFDVKVETKIVKPVTYIRKMEAFKEVVEK